MVMRKRHNSTHTCTLCTTTCTHVHVPLHVHMNIMYHPMYTYMYIMYHPMHAHICSMVKMYYSFKPQQDKQRGFKGMGRCLPNDLIIHKIQMLIVAKVNIFKCRMQTIIQCRNGSCSLGKTYSCCCNEKWYLV